MFDSVVYSWGDSFQLNSCYSRVLLQNNDLCFLSRIMDFSYSIRCNVILLGGNDTRGYGGDLFSSSSPFECSKFFIVRSAEEFDALMRGRPTKKITLSEELRRMVG
eukprot:TRINITY_DN1483_c8_g1_i1.p1 TRINITY_DN1483_c8_g1~~TRINITY_DN1483_c8_g1_i1.p1  ORF type:complete len:106 (-),score=3.66 TRINITY_DN1483_c8_g1_i1:134-451(-)